jgi:hypothetical protein
VNTHRPPACHYDRQLGERVTREHRDDCPHPGDHQGCKPCTAPHCVVCGRNHTNNDQPATCPTCISKVDDDLGIIAEAEVLLAGEAVDASRDGRPAAAAPIPGGNAQVLIGPTVRLDLLRTGSAIGMATFRDDHHDDDPLPPLAVLAQWEDIWRAYLAHPRIQTVGRRLASRDAAPPPAPSATIAGAVAYLGKQLRYMAQLQDPAAPDWAAFTRQMRTLRAHLERALHDEREPQRGVECFECGDRLVRRFHRPTPCRHSTAARDELARWARLGYPEALSPVDVRAARQPCGECDQGGITDPSAGLSWECPACRREFDPGEYATAVRRDLLENGAEGDGWTHMAMAASAASTLTGHLVPTNTVRQWVVRGKVDSKVSAVGVRLVYWPDVADEAAEAVRRLARAAEARRQRDVQRAAWLDAVAAGEDPEAAGERLAIHPSRVAKFVEEHDAQSA